MQIPYFLFCRKTRRFIVSLQDTPVYGKNASDPRTYGIFGLSRVGGHQIRRFRNKPRDARETAVSYRGEAVFRKRSERQYSFRARRKIIRDRLRFLTKIPNFHVLWRRGVFPEPLFLFWKRSFWKYPSALRSAVGSWGIRNLCRTLKVSGIFRALSGFLR